MSSYATTRRPITKSAGAIEYTDCICVEGHDLPHEFPGYNTKQSDDEGPGKGCPVGWGCKIHRLHHCRGVRALPPYHMSLNNLMVRLQ